MANFMTAQNSTMRVAYFCSWCVLSARGTVCEHGLLLFKWI